MIELSNKPRKLVTIRQISEIRPIPNANAIEVAADRWVAVTNRH